MLGRSKSRPILRRDRCGCGQLLTRHQLEVLGTAAPSLRVPASRRCSIASSRARTLSRSADATIQTLPIPTESMRASRVPLLINRIRALCSVGIRRGSSFVLEQQELFALMTVPEAPISVGWKPTLLDASSRRSELLARLGSGTARASCSKSKSALLGWHGRSTFSKRPSLKVASQRRSIASARQNPTCVLSRSGGV
jgi:hypothetical protein